MHSKIIITASLFMAVFDNPLLVKRGGSAWYVSIVTDSAPRAGSDKNCCVAVNHTAFYNEVAKVCKSSASHAVNYSAFVNCCNKLGVKIRGLRQ